MNDKIIGEIEAEYDEYCLDRTKNLDLMYKKLYAYLLDFIMKYLKRYGTTSWHTAEDVAQDVLTEIATDKIHTFQKKEAKFTTFCTVIAKNKVIDFLRRLNRHSLYEYNALEEKIAFHFGTKETYSNPETLVMKLERRLEQIEATKKYLHKMVSQTGKPYRIVSCCYAMILFHRYHPKSKELSSPKWAFEKIHKDTVEKSSDNFMEEMNEWFPNLHLCWGDTFLDGMEEIENDICVRNIIFGEHFNVKDFENWSLRMRKKMREELLEDVCEVL